MHDSALARRGEDAVALPIISMILDRAWASLPSRSCKWLNSIPFFYTHSIRHPAETRLEKYDLFS